VGLQSQARKEIERTVFTSQNKPFTAGRSKESDVSFAISGVISGNDFIG
jgi:hypothetical protein